MMWVWLLLDDVCSDMSVYHRVNDILKLPGVVFWRLADRLPAYNGAVTRGMERLSKELETVTQADARELLYDYVAEELVPDEEPEVETETVLTAEQLVALGPAAPALGQDVPIFEVVKCT
jgi:hypothetical protein